MDLQMAGSFYSFSFFFNCCLSTYVLVNFRCVPLGFLRANQKKKNGTGKGVGNKHYLCCRFCKLCLEDCEPRVKISFRMVS